MATIKAKPKTLHWFTCQKIHIKKAYNLWWVCTAHVILLEFTFGVIPSQWNIPAIKRSDKLKEKKNIRH